jgi:hypothetical protein
LNADVFAEWFRGQQRCVVKSESSYWVEHASHVFQALPYHWVISPGEEELKEILVKNKGIGLRYSTPLEMTEGLISYHAVLENKKYDEYSLSKWSRKNVRRGIRHCEFRPISLKLVSTEGWDLQVDTLRRQGRKVNLTREEWIKRWDVASVLPGFEAWGAFSGKKLVSSVVTFILDDCCYMLYQQCLSQYLKDHINNALSFNVSQTMIRRPGIESILYGLHSLDAPPSIDEFKFRMGYYPKLVRQRVVFNPKFRLLINSTSLKMTRMMVSIFPGAEFLSKAEGMMRFASEGKKKLADQTWPEAIISRENNDYPLEIAAYSREEEIIKT